MSTELAIWHGGKSLTDLRRRRLKLVQHSRRPYRAIRLLPEGAAPIRSLFQKLCQCLPHSPLSSAISASKNRRKSSNPPHSGWTPAGSLISLCYPNTKSITTALFHESDACFGRWPSNLTCTEAERRAYVFRMVNRMTEGVRSFVCSFIFWYIDYQRVVKLDWRTTPTERSKHRSYLRLPNILQIRAQLLN
jgi:hypothetical protein